MIHAFSIQFKALKSFEFWAFSTKVRERYVNIELTEINMAKCNRMAKKVSSKVVC